MSFSKFGYLAEYAVGLSLKNCGWNVFFSKGSRGPADIVAKKGDIILLIQVKSSTRIPKICGLEIRNLISLSDKIDHSFPIVSLVYPKTGYNSTTTTISFGNYSISFLLLPEWESADFIKK